MGLIENDDVVEQVVPKASNPSFDNSVLPWAAVFIQGRSLMRAIRTWGSVRGVPGDWHPYRDLCWEAPKNNQLGLASTA